MHVSRRNFLKEVGVCALLATGSAQRAFALLHHCESVEWAKELKRICEQLFTHAITLNQWQSEIHRIYSHIQLDSLLTSIDFESLRSVLDPSKPGGDWHQIFVTGLSNPANSTKLITKVVALRQGYTVPPHGHENEVSTFLTLHGEFRLRQWDRISIDQNAVTVSSLYSGTSQAGQWSTQSEDKTNIHWLLTDSDVGYFLSVRLAKIDGTETGRERIFLDPVNSVDVGSGYYRIPIMEKSEWWQKYSRF